MARNLLTVKNFAERHADAFSEGSIRRIVFNADENGLPFSASLQERRSIDGERKKCLGHFAE